MPHEPVSTLADVARKIELRDECRRPCRGFANLARGANEDAVSDFIALDPRLHERGAIWTG
jgi:hypothetical protein